MKVREMLQQVVAILLLGVVAIAISVMVAFTSAYASEHSTDHPDVSAPVVLVATSVLEQGGYRETVLLAVPRPDGGHFGFVLNRPTTTQLGQLFPDDKASQRVQANVHVGGPHLAGAIFALVQGAPLEAGRGAVQVTPQLHIALDVVAVDRVIEQRADEARFFAGAVVWQPGELIHELGAGAWEVRALDSELLMRADAASLWQQLASTGQFAPNRRSRLRTA